MANYLIYESVSGISLKRTVTIGPFVFSSVEVFRSKHRGVGQHLNSKDYVVWSILSATSEKEVSELTLSRHKYLEDVLVIYSNRWRSSIYPQIPSSSQSNSESVTLSELTLGKVKKSYSRHFIVGVGSATSLHSKQYKTKGINHVVNIYDYTIQNNLQKRILNAVKWLGQATKESRFGISTDQSRRNCVLSLAISLETMLTLDTNIYGPSIVSQISDNAAFLIAKKYEDRIVIVDRLKKFYRLRSDVVHGNLKPKASVNVDLKDIYYYSFELLNRLAHFSEQGVNDLNELKKMHIHQIKYR